MATELLYIEREYIRMETLIMGNPLAVLKKDYDRILFLTEIYGESLLIPSKEVVNVIPLIEKDNKLFELSATGSYFIPIKDLKLTIGLSSPKTEN